jgi:hypothetical protein
MVFTTVIGDLPVPSAMHCGPCDHAHQTRGPPDAVCWPNLLAAIRDTDGNALAFVARCRNSLARYLIPTTIEHEPHRCSLHTVLKPAAFIHPTQSAPV